MTPRAVSSGSQGSASPNPVMTSSMTIAAASRPVAPCKACTLAVAMSTPCSTIRRTADSRNRYRQRHESSGEIVNSKIADNCVDVIVSPERFEENPFEPDPLEQWNLAVIAGDCDKRCVG